MAILHRSYALMSLAAVALCAAIVAPAVAMGRGLARFVDAALALFTPEPMRLATESYGMTLSIGGHALARDVQQGLRHEAGVPRYAAQRNR